jgi:O-antigen ligase
MKLSLKKIYTGLFLLGIFFIPFNSFMGIKGLGEFKREPGAYFLILGFLVLLIESSIKARIRLPYKNYIFQLLLIFMLLCFLSFVFNISAISGYYFKKTSGISRFIRQFFALSLSVLVFFSLYWNVVVNLTTKEILHKIRKIFLYSFIAVSIYGFFEILYQVFGLQPAYSILRIFDYFPFTEFDSDAKNRISSVCFEPPALATFLITVAGWMFSYIITHKTSLKYIPTIVVIILTYFSGSRTALVVVLFQLFVFLLVVLSRQQKIYTLMYVTFAILFFSGFVVLTKGDKIIRDVQNKIESLDIRGNLKNNVSNQSRLGIQYANLVVFTNHPILGLGFGQQAYEAMYYYPLWAKQNNWEFKGMYLNKSDPMFPPGYNLYVRLLAETGIIGFVFFIYFLYVIVSRTRRIIKRNHSDQEKTLALILLVTFAGFIVNWLQLDTFRMYGFWLCLAILIKLSTQINTNLNEK